MNITIKPVDTPEEAVEQGAQLFDKTMPGWETTVQGAMSDGLFRMENWDRCMVGTLELWVDREHHDEGYVSFNGLSFRARSNESRWVGFLPLSYDDDAGFNVLDRLWREQVNKRTGEEN